MATKITLPQPMMDTLKRFVSRSPDLSEFKPDDDVLCLATWDSGYRITSCKSEKLAEVAMDAVHDILKSSQEESFNIRFIKSDGKIYKPVVKSVELVETGR